MTDILDLLAEQERLYTLRDEGRRVWARLKELNHKTDFILLTNDLVYAVHSDKILYKEGLAITHDKGVYDCFNWIGCKKEIESTNRKQKE